MIRKIAALILLLTFSSTFLYGQDQQVYKEIRGKITDKETYQPLIGVRVVLLGVEPFNAAVTDLDGAFRLTNVPLGRQSIEISYIGYESQVKSNIDVASKDIILTIELVESVSMINEVTVEARKKGEVINQMATVSARTFSIEESNRYAGSKNDVARMAQNFAGVQGADDSRNDIVIRGNSPAGVLFRMEGIDIPNPNHFARFGTSGGPISMLNNNMLSNSDFMTGAFPAEYGNAIAGVFDLNMRKGNNEAHDFMFQFGFNGAELMAEGPISRKKGSSYVVNYRYSTLELFKLMGINFGSSATPNYQDASFKLHFPTKKGYTSVFGMGGVSEINILAENADSSDLFALDFSNTRFKSNVGIVGLTHKRRVGSKAFLKFSTGLQSSLNNIMNDTVDEAYQNAFTTYNSNSTISKQTNDIFYNHKINARHFFKIGFHTDLYLLNLNDSVYNSGTDSYISLRDFKGNTFFWQPYFQYQLRASDKIRINLGLHAQSLSLNEDFMLEPRAGMSWDITKKDRFSLGYGLHSQMQPIELYFYQKAEGDVTTMPNKNLDFTKSHHAVLGYQHRFNLGINAKFEAYYQYLYDVPVEQNSSTYSILNFGADFASIIPDSLQSTGTGENFGVELTIEKYLKKGFYFLITTSIYDSKYTASNGESYNTAFNGNFTFNTLAGYEFRFKDGKNSVTLDAKFTLNGGKKFTPILLEESNLAKTEIRDFENAYSATYPNYIRGDFRIAFKTIGKKITQEWAVDMQNITNYKNVFYQEYSVARQSVNTIYQTGFLPIAQYRLYF